MWIGVLWAGLRVAMWITHVGGKFHHGLLEKSLNILHLMYDLSFWNSKLFGATLFLQTCHPRESWHGEGLSLQSCGHGADTFRA